MRVETIGDATLYLGARAGGAAMTRAHAARRLLEHGALTLREFIDITGWTYGQAQGVLRHLLGRGEVRHIKRPESYLYQYGLAA